MHSMASVLHFAPEGTDQAVCGARTFLCDECTDDRNAVECKRCKRTRAFTCYDPTRFDVDVWSHEGDVIRWFRRVTADEVDGIRKEYEDNPTVEVVATECE